MNAVVQPSLFDETDSEMDIASEIRKEVNDRFHSENVTHLRVRSGGNGGWVIHGFCPDTDTAVISAVKKDDRGRWFKLVKSGLREVEPPMAITASRFTIIKRPIED